jgi:hypothetical protein
MSELSRLAEADPPHAVAMLESLPCSLVRSAYGDELVLGFGKTRPSLPPLEGEQADWMLYSRATPWALESSMGVVLNSYGFRRLNKRKLEAIRRTILGAKVRGTQLRNRALGLTITFANGANFLFLPPEPSRGFDPEYDAWQLALPDRRIVTANRDEQLTFISPSDPLPPLTDPLELLEMEAADAAPRVPVAARREEFTRHRNFQHLLTLLLKSSGYEVFIPVRDSAIDALVVSPDGLLVGLQLKLRREGDPQLPPNLQRLVVLTVIPASVAPFSKRSSKREVSRNRALVFWSGESLEPIEAALRDLARSQET